MSIATRVKELFSERPKSLIGWSLIGLIVGVFAVFGQMVGKEVGTRAAEEEMAARVATSPAAASISSGKEVSGCWVVPLEERHKLSAECQQRLGKSDIERSRFMECFRLLNVAGVQQGKCDTSTRRYVLDLKGENQRILALSTDGTPLFAIKLAADQQ